MRWFKTLKDMLFPNRDSHDETLDPEPLDYHPAHEGETPDDLHRGRHRIKETFTSHWDLDYMPREELEEKPGREKIIVPSGYCWLPPRRGRGICCS